MFSIINVISSFNFNNYRYNYDRCYKDYNIISITKFYCYYKDVRNIFTGPICGKTVL